MEFASYPKVLRLGHRFVDGILDGEIVVQEKIDGSQLNWTWDAEGDLHVRSKGMWQYGGPENRTEPEGMFKPAIEHLLTIERNDGYWQGLFFRGETVTKLRHNTLTYERVPAGKIVLFDVTDAGWREENPGDLQEWANVLEVDMTPTYYRGPGHLWAGANGLLDNVSILGGPIEGVVIKNYSKMDVEGKPMMAKVVREEFQELHQRAWKSDNPTKSDVVQQIVEALNTPARFEKAVQHLNEQGLLVNAEQDIGKLMSEVKRDVMEEEVAWITERLVKAFMPQVVRGIGRSLPDWYKERLARG